MFLLLILSPFFALICAIFLYKFTGNKDFLKFDLVQFVYGFLITPMIFIWGKFFIFELLKFQIGITLSMRGVFLIDTLYSLVFLFLASFVVIHSLTKSFSLKIKNDPFYDLFAHSEFFHQEFSHLFIYFGAFFTIALVSLINVVWPYPVEIPNYYLWWVLVIGIISGTLGFLGIWNFETKEIFFMRWMKLIMAFFFMIHVIVYAWLDLKFDSSLIFYWLIFMTFTAMTVLALFAERRSPTSRLTKYLPLKINLKKIKYYWWYLQKVTTKILKKRSK